MTILKAYYSESALGHKNWEFTNSDRQFDGISFPLRTVKEVVKTFFKFGAVLTRAEVKALKNFDSVTREV